MATSARSVARLGATTLDWLARYGVEFDELHFGKPHADVYIDDNALRFEGWELIAGDGSTLPLSHEKTFAAGSSSADGQRQ